MWEVTNPNGVNTNQPLVYFIRIKSPNHEYRYVGKSSSAGRLLSAYHRNIERILAGETKRPRFKKNGERQSEGNLRYRRVHLALARAVEEGWLIEHYPLANADKAFLNATEKYWMKKMDCNLNNGPTWAIEDCGKLAGRFS